MSDEKSALFYIHSGTRCFVSREAYFLISPRTPGSSCLWGHTLTCTGCYWFPHVGHLLLFRAIRTERISEGNVLPSDLLPAVSSVSLSSCKTGASRLVWLVVIKAWSCLIWKIKQQFDEQIKVSEITPLDHFLWTLQLHLNPLILSIWTDKRLCKYVTTHLSNYLEERRNMSWERGKKMLWLLEVAPRPSVELSSAGCSLSHWEMPEGQTETLWFLFKSYCI